MVAWQAILCTLALSASGETVLLDFSATWCGPCRQMDPVVQQLIAAGQPIRKVDIDQQPELAKRFKVDGVPCFVMLVDGREVARQSGVLPRAQLEQMLSMGRGRPATPATFGAPNIAAAGSAAGPETGRPRLIPKQISEPFNKLAQGVRGVVQNTLPGQNPPVQVDPQVVETLMGSTARIRIMDGDGRSTGTGTIVDYRSGEALIVTCAHIFRESKGTGEIEVDLFGANGRRTVPGKVVSYDLTSDVGLLRIRPGSPVNVAPIAPFGTQLRKGDTVISVGCSHGDDPSSAVSQITSLDKYTGPSNIQVAGQPVQGRSGGGLFTATGALIGVCNAADPQDNEGLYASLKVIHGELGRVGLDQILVRPAEFAAAPPAMPTQMPGPGALANSNVRAIGQSPDPQSLHDVTHVALSPAEAAMLQEVRSKAKRAEVICIVRGNEQSDGRIVVLDQASPEFLARLASDAQRQGNLPISSNGASMAATAQALSGGATTGGAPTPTLARPSIIPQIRR